mgnify:CR=1 FL=1
MLRALYDQSLDVEKIGHIEQVVRNCGQLS